MQIKEIKTSEEVGETFDVLAQIYDELDRKAYLKNVKEMLAKDYRMAAVYESGKVGTQAHPKCIGVIGVRIINKIQYGKCLEISDFMIARNRRGIGVGKMLIRWVEWQAAKLKCANIVGSLETKRLESQRIFSREKFLLDGFWFRKGC